MIEKPEAPLPSPQAGKVPSRNKFAGMQIT